MSLTNNKSDRLYRRVADELADAIRKGTYVPGDKLPPERELAETFGVSRPTVREAMIALEIYGVVEIRHGSGIYVVAPERGDETPPAREDLNVGAFELIEARIIIEGETAAVAAAGVNDADIATLDTLIARMRNGDEAECEQADREFHSHLAGITENSALIDTIEHMWDLRTRSPLASQIMGRAQGGGRAARIEEHEKIVEALKSRDPAAARAAMRAHLEQVREYLLVATETAELESLRQKLRAQRDVLSRRTGY
ncbi:FadR/GntR family transcriptional regulator [Asticcacaulis solisilvae]|uniref:FadR/GntR family transcriptional regulator n=1 Tax=Asticcacaulis solisilvae TaxID=1217274 RepID=UPI003FD7FF15